jgi:Tol biopolymer transport system component
VSPGEDATMAGDTSVSDAGYVDGVGAPDASANDADATVNPVDASMPDAGPCVLGPFSTPTSIGWMGLQPSLYGPRLSRDGLTMFFSQTARGTFRDEDIYVSKRASLTSAFGTATVVSELTTRQQEGTAFLLWDDLTLYFSSERPGGVGGRDIWVAKRPTPTSPFGTPTDVTELNSTSWEHLPSFTSDGLVVFFSSDRNGGIWDIFTASRSTPTGTFSTPVTVTEVSPPASTDTGPFITPDGLTLYFVTNLTRTGIADFNIWMTTRSSRTAPFDPPVRVDLFNTTFNDQDPYMTADGLEFYFSTDRGGNGFEIYRSVRSCQ